MATQTRERKFNVEVLESLPINPQEGDEYWRLLRYTDPDCEQAVWWELYKARFEYEEYDPEPRDAGPQATLEPSFFKHVCRGVGHMPSLAEALEHYAFDEDSEEGVNGSPPSCTCPASVCPVHGTIDKSELRKGRRTRN